MSRLALVLALVFLTALSAHAQSVSVLQEARLFAEPDERAEVKATLPAGVRLTVVAEQDGWLAVSTSTGVAGWVLRSLVSELDSTPAPRTTEPAPEPPPVETPEVQPERPTEVVEDPPQMEEAPPQQTEPSVVSREPVYRTRPPVEQGPGGFFDVKKWWPILST